MIADFCAGWAAGGAGLLIGHPLDTIKARLQTMNVYKGIVDCTLTTLRQESVFGLYKGVFAPFMSTGVQHSLIFVGYGAALKFLHPGESNVDARKDLPMREIMLASVCGTMLQLGPAIPIEMAKTKLQVQRGSERRQYRGTLDCIKQTVKENGVRGAFKGGGVMCVRDNIGYMFYLPVYEGLLRVFRRRNVDDTAAQMFAGGVAGAMSWFSICPLEVIKNRIQTEKMAAKVSCWQMAANMRRHEGLGVFYRGGLTISIRGFVVNAVLFVVYERALNYFGGIL